MGGDFPLEMGRGMVSRKHKMRNSQRVNQDGGKYRTIKINLKKRIPTLFVVAF